MHIFKKDGYCLTIKDNAIGGGYSAWIRGNGIQHHRDPNLGVAIQPDPLERSHRAVTYKNETIDIPADILDAAVSFLRAARPQTSHVDQVEMPGTAVPRLQSWEDCDHCGCQPSYVYPDGHYCRKCRGIAQCL